MEIIIKDGIVENLEDLMDGSQWCELELDGFYSRECAGEISGVPYKILEMHRPCSDGNNTRIWIVPVAAGSMNPFLGYKITDPSYQRHPILHLNN
jgi:hypothetical protein